MSKKLIVAMALSLVLVSGALFSARADCGNLSPCSYCGAKNADLRNLDFQPDYRAWNMEQGNF